MPKLIMIRADPADFAGKGRSPSLPEGEACVMAPAKSTSAMLGSPSAGAKAPSGKEQHKGMKAGARSDKVGPRKKGNGFGCTAPGKDVPLIDLLSDNEGEASRCSSPPIEPTSITQIAFDMAGLSLWQPLVPAKSPRAAL